jgi:hypothetical protein
MSSGIGGVGAAAAVGGVGAAAAVGGAGVGGAGVGVGAAVGGSGFKVLISVSLSAFSFRRVVTHGMYLFTKAESWLLVSRGAIRLYRETNVTFGNFSENEDVIVSGS